MAGIRRGFSPLIEAEKFLPQGQTSLSSSTFPSGKRLGKQAYTKNALKPDCGKTWMSCCILQMGPAPWWRANIPSLQWLQDVVAAAQQCHSHAVPSAGDAAPKQQYSEQPGHCQAMAPAANTPQQLAGFGVLV